jgi:hypothetical protein
MRSLFLSIPNGLFDPDWWRNNKCRTTTTTRINGRTKWMAKNRLRVALSTANPPHIHSTSVLPMYGIAENRLVITVAPQKLICPHGNT